MGVALNAARRYWFLPVASGIATILALWTADLTLSAVSGAGAALFAGAFLFLAVRDRVHRSWAPPETYDADPLALLARSFHTGVLGRETILARMDSLELAFGLPPGGWVAPRESLVALPDGEFLDYVDRRLRDLEIRT